MEDPLYQALYRFYTDTIRRNLGLRGHTLQMRVELARSSVELLALREAWLAALWQARGNDVARALRHELEMLLRRSRQPA
ncbi:MAG TPA: hypothetical protein VM406_00695 [Noviherbaspirillum sp.]|nr:hypothetical protein [Noviherbaspirillum sp.]